MAGFNRNIREQPSNNIRTGSLSSTDGKLRLMFVGLKLLW